MTTYEQEFAGSKEMVAKAREWVAGLVAHTGPVRAAEIELCASELATNAVLHSMSGSPQGTYAITVKVMETTVTLVVTDQGPTLIPLPRRPADESGRGVFLVEQLADEYVRHGNESIALFDNLWSTR